MARLYHKINGRFVQIKHTVQPTIKTARQQLVDFMKNLKYSIVKESSETYTRKNGSVIPVIRITFSNNKDYLVSNKTFWKAN